MQRIPLYMYLRGVTVPWADIELRFIVSLMYSVVVVVCKRKNRKRKSNTSVEEIYHEVKSIVKSLEY